MWGEKNSGPDMVTWGAPVPQGVTEKKSIEEAEKKQIERQKNQDRAVS